MADNFIPVNTPLLSGNEQKYLNECIETGWISSEGPFVTKFEKSIAKYVDREFGIACSSGSGALDIAIAALNIGTGDEVIMPSFTIISPALSIIRSGAMPVLVDSDPSTWNMDVSQIEDKINENTKAILVVHIYGLPVDMDPVLSLCKKYDLKLIEDAAEMQGQTYKGKPCGSFGDISIFSFYPNKHITTGEGGMCLTNNEELEIRCRKLRNLAFEPEKRRFVHEEMGWNYRMTNLQAAIGLAQFEKIVSHIKRKREIGEMYNDKLEGISGIQKPLNNTIYAENIYWVYGLVCDTQSQCESHQNQLKMEGIGTRPFFWCMHEQPVFLKRGLFKEEKYPTAEKLARTGFYLPSGLAIKKVDINIVAKKLKLISDKYGEEN